MSCDFMHLPMAAAAVRRGTRSNSTAIRLFAAVAALAGFSARLPALGILAFLHTFPLLAAPPSASWPRTFSDEFSGSSIDSSKWSSGSLPWGGRHHNNEYASYIMPEDSYVSGGSLWLRCRKASGNEFGGYPYSEGFVHTQGKLNFLYGYVEIRARFPTGKGVWPAFWTLSWEAGWPPEFDIAEYFGTDDRMHLGLAYGTGSGQWNSSNFYNEGVSGWHTWALEWGPGYALWFKDGVLKKAIYQSYVPSVPKYIILNSGMRWDADGSTPFPNYFEVDYFRKYNPPSAVVNDNTTGTGVNQFNYVGTWGYSSESQAFFNDNHWSGTIDAYAEFRFNGNRIDLHGAKAPNHGIAAISVDGGPETLVDCYAPSRRERALLWTGAGFGPGTKTLRVRVTGTRHPSSTGNAIGLDRASVWNVSGFLTGTLIGTDGSYQDQGNTKEKAVDGDLGSYFDAPISSGAWVGLDLATPKRITKVRYAPRNGFPGRMTGGKFQGANAADFSDAVDFFTIPSPPLEETVTDQNISLTNGFRYVRYLAPEASQGNVAVVEFYGNEPESYNGTWIVDASGNWSDATKWSGAVVANGANSTADFSTLNILADRTVTLDTARSITTLRFGDTSGGQTWTLDASEGAVLTLDPGAGLSPIIAVNQNTTTILAPLDGESGFTKNGGGTLVLSGDNPLSGTVHLDRWADGSSLNDGAVRVTASAAAANVTQFSIRNTSVTTGGGRLELDGSEHEIYLSANLSTTMRNNIVGNLRNLAGSNTFSGNIHVFTGGTNVVFQSDAGTLALAGDVQYVGNLTSARSYSFVGAGDALVVGNLLNSTNGANISVRKTGDGTLTLAGENTHTGTNFISGHGALRAASSPALGRGLTSIGAAPADTCRLELTGDITLTNQLTFAVRANNPAPHFVNVSGTNVLHPPASLSHGAGGNQMGLRSDAGRLVLTKGITVTGGSGKLIYLEGAGDGEIQGAITQAAPANTIVGVLKQGAGTWTLADLITTSGALTNRGGTLVVNRTVTVTNVSIEAGATLAGHGTITGPVTIHPDGHLAPGTSIGQLTISNALTLAGTTWMELNKAAQTHDRIAGLASITYGGILVVTNLDVDLAMGDSFLLFEAASHEGSFAHWSLPPLNPGLAWKFISSNGTLSVVSGVATHPTNITAVVSHGTMELSWPAEHRGWTLQAQTNTLAEGLGLDWHIVPESDLTNRVFVPVDPANPAVFYRLVSPD